MLSNLKIILAVLATIGICYGLHSCDVSRIEANQKTALETQKTELTTQCNASKKTTEDIDHDLTNDLFNINSRASIGVSQNCVVVQSPERTTSDNDTCGTGHARPNGLSSEWLKQYAKQANIYRAQINACQKLLTAERVNQ